MIPLVAWLGTVALRRSHASGQRVKQLVTP
jgi:hypothetical protein